MAMLRKQLAGVKALQAAALPVPSGEMEQYVWLHEFLFMAVWEEDGTVRVPGTVLLFAEGLHLKAMLNDKDGNRVAFTVLNPDRPVLEELNEAIASASTDWRASRERPTRRA